MFKSRKRLILAFFVSMTFMLSSFVVFPSFAKSRRITIKKETSSGKIKEISIYSGCRALVIGVSGYDLWPDLTNVAKDAEEEAK